MKKITHLLFPLFLLVLAFSCTRMVEESAKKNDRLLASVNGKGLYFSEVSEMIPRTTPEDSARIISNYTNRWVRDMVLLSEAEKAVPGDLNIDKLVRDYRASLIVNAYKERLVEEELKGDSLVSEHEVKAYYEKNKASFQLEKPIMRCYFIKFPTDAPNLDYAKKLFESSKPDDIKKLLAYANENALAFSLNDSTWLDVNIVAAEFPSETLTENNISKKRTIAIQEDAHYYYFKMLELRLKNEIAPYAHIEEQARKHILHQKKIELLAKKREELYQTALNQNNVAFME